MFLKFLIEFTPRNFSIFNTRNTKLAGAEGGEAEMSSSAHQPCGLNSRYSYPPLSSSRFSASSWNWNRFSPNQRPKVLPLVSAAASSPSPISNAQTKGRLKLKQLFKEAYERCCTAPMDGISFTLEDFHAALANYDFVTELGTKVRFPEQFSFIVI